jgi:tRNA 2-selenouridine synthase
MELPLIDDYRRLFIEDVPLLDVRAPLEFHKGALPQAENHPLINDEERHKIGTRYANMGQDAAMELGYELIKGETRGRRIRAWEAFARAHPEGVLYCWRGGMRSQLTQQALYEESGILYPRVKGGYKALRTFLIDELELSAAEVHPFIIGGRTGVGKTRFINKLPNSIDLEDLAKHRGSAFGPRAEPQPNQVDFENTLAIALIKHRARGNPPLVLEDEGRNIGSRIIPESFFRKMRSAPLLILDVPLEQRIEITFQEYIIDALAENRALFGDEPGQRKWAESLLGNIDKIRKRLGGERHKQLSALMQNAIYSFEQQDDTSIFKELIRELLTHYYDPMYDFQIGKRRDSIVMQGDGESIIDYMKTHA